MKKKWIKFNFDEIIHFPDFNIPSASCVRFNQQLLGVTFISK